MQGLENILDVLNMKRRRLEKDLALDLAKIEEITIQLTQKSEQIDQVRNKLFSTNVAFVAPYEGLNFEKWKALQDRHCAWLSEEKKTLTSQLNQKREQMKALFVQEDIVKVRIRTLSLAIKRHQEEGEASSQLENWIAFN